MRKFIKSKKATRLLVFTLLLTLLLSLFTACASSEERSCMLSPALDSIASQNTMAKSAMRGSPISFTPEDFARAVNLPSISSLTLTEVPSLTDGQLRVGSTVLSAGQKIEAASISLMTYVPASNISSSEFKFRVDDSPYELTCKLYMLDKANHAPTLSSVPKAALEVSTYRNITLFGSLPCYDVDGDQTYIEIVSYPEKGVLVLDDRQTGSYRYIPSSDSSGKDSFVYVARDMYGNYSASATVSLTINKQQQNTTFVDLIDTKYHTSAIAVSEAGIMSGTQVGGATYFYPERTVSRGEFTVMLLNAAGIKDVVPTSTTPFDDDADISSDMKGYISAAYELGVVKGTPVDGKLCFEPDRAITRAEAAVMMAKLLDADVPTVKPVFADSESIPTWAESSLYAVNALGVMSPIDENIAPTESVTRGDAAVMLNNISKVKPK